MNEDKMIHHLWKVIVASAAVAFASCTAGNVELLIVGGGASGVSAAVQAGREGVRTMLVEETQWLGGMLTSAGVSAFDGNQDMRSGIFGEFVDSLSAWYGGEDRLRTGWVSDIMFQPRVGNRIFRNMIAALPSVSVRYGTICAGARKTRRGWEVTLQDAEGRKTRVRTEILVDATELGDVLALCGAPCRKGVDAGNDTGEVNAPERPSSFVQDMTYVLTVKDYGSGADKTVRIPEGYREELYRNCCRNPLNEGLSVSSAGDTVIAATGQRLWSADMMLSYGKLPSRPGESAEYMLNWPIYGNDCYADVIDLDSRTHVLDSVKNVALGYLYFMQTALGMKNIGISDEEYPTPDGLPFYPYYRESRRVRGEVFFTMDDAAHPYSSDLYRTGIACGDYPVDHHHSRNPEWDGSLDLWFYPIPSYNLPLGVLIPDGFDGLLAAEKSVSVSSLVNGTTRLQPMAMQIGQAAGALASAALKRHGGDVRRTGVREVQTMLLDSGGYIMPYADLPKSHPHFKALQRIGATGIMRGRGLNAGWKNLTLFRAGDKLDPDEVYLEDFWPGKTWEELGLPDKETARQMTREDFAVLLDSTLHPFETFPVTLSGALTAR